MNYQYDNAGRILSRVMSSGNRSVYGYDTGGWLTSMSHQDSAGTVVSAQSYTRDHVGNITSLNTTAGASTGASSYTLDALYRLTAVNAPTTANSEAFSYDHLGNRITNTKGGTSIGATGSTTRYYNYFPATQTGNPGYTATLNNRLKEVRIASASGTLESSFVFDNDGRLTSQTGTSPRTITWDAKGRVHSLGAETYTYDPSNQRIGRTGGSLGNLAYYLEGDNLESVESAGVLLEKYFRGSAPDELVAGYTPQNGVLTPFLFQHDQVMSVSAETNPNGGTQAAMTYSAFGATQATTGTPISRLQFAGRENDGTGLYYNRARDYDPAIGRFISEDPKKFAAGINFYAYVGSNPINANDPSGLDLVAVPMPAQGGVEKNFLFDTKIAPAMSAFVRDIRDHGIPVTVNLAFRTTELQTTLYNDRANNQNPVAKPGTSKHESGFAIDINGADPTRGLSGADRVYIEEVASQYGLSTVGGVKYDPNVGGRPIDPPHFDADPTAYGYTSKASAIQSNQLDYAMHDLTDFTSMKYSVSRDTDMSAAGGFLLYPNKPNTNQLLNVYSK